LKAIVKALSKVDAPTLIEAVTAYSFARKGANSQFTPYPSTWFNESRWEDDRANWVDKQNHNQQNRGASHTDFYDEGLTLKDA